MERLAGILPNIYKSEYKSIIKDISCFCELLKGIDKSFDIKRDLNFSTIEEEFRINREISFVNNQGTFVYFQKKLISFCLQYSWQAYRNLGIQISDLAEASKILKLLSNDTIVLTSLSSTFYNTYVLNGEWNGAFRQLVEIALNQFEDECLLVKRSSPHPN